MPRTGGTSTAKRPSINQHDASRRVIYQLAHEIRNPLGGLRGAAQLLERQLSTEELREYTRIIIGEADRLAALTDSLLGPARNLRREPENIHEILERVRTLLENEAPGGVIAGARLRPEPAADLGGSRPDAAGRAQHRAQCRAGRQPGAGTPAAASPCARAR